MTSLQWPTGLYTVSFKVILGMNRKEQVTEFQGQDTFFTFLARKNLGVWESFSTDRDHSWCLRRECRNTAFTDALRQVAPHTWLFAGEKNTTLPRRLSAACLRRCWASDGSGRGWFPAARAGGGGTSDHLESCVIYLCRLGPPGLWVLWRWAGCVSQPRAGQASEEGVSYLRVGVLAQHSPRVLRNGSVP